MDNFGDMKLSHSVPAPILTAIGDVVVSFALLEQEVQNLSGTMLDQDAKVGKIVAASMSFSNRRALAISLFKHRYGESEDLELLRKLLRTAEQMEVKRNQIMHSIWGKGPSPETVVRLKATAREREGLAFQQVTVGADDLLKVAEDIRAVAWNLTRFRIGSRSQIVP
jgi:hypothetical protein